MLWSDGKERSDNFEGSDLYRAIRQFYADRNEEIRLELLWDNEYMRKELELTRQRSASAAA